MNAALCATLFLVVATTTVNAGSISICVNTKANGVVTNVNGATVQCWDEDLDGDDVMTGAVATGANGCATLQYTSKFPKWYNPCTAWDCPGYTNPDIYCKVTKTGLYPLFTDTKEDWNQDYNANFGTMTIYPWRNTPVGTANGCGPASNWPGINDVATFITGFGNMCNNHDYCYSTCGETKGNCDDEFKAMMYSKCNDFWDTSNKVMCKTVADGMFALVKDLGGPAYTASRVGSGCP